MTIEKIYLESVIKRFREYKTLGDKTFDQLNDEQMHFSPNGASNSIAVIIQHMHGNMLSRWTNFLTEDGEKEWRKRDEEFENTDLSKAALLLLWEEGYQVVFDSLGSLKEEDLTGTIFIRSQPLNVVDAINRQLAHYSYHVGQIVYLGRLQKDQDWASLSIPRGASMAYTQKMEEKNRQKS